MAKVLLLDSDGAPRDSLAAELSARGHRVVVQADHEPATQLVRQEIVLIVDDSAENRDVAARWIRHHGIAVDCALDGRTAMELMSRQPYDAILLDIMMPVMDGFAVLRELRRTHSPTDLPVIMGTAKDNSRDILEAFKLGANDYVTKPFDLPVLLARLRTQISLKRAVEEVRRLEHGLAERNRELHLANERMQKYLDAAAQVQRALLPEKAPNIPGYRFAWSFQPCAGLAGDILNLFSLDEGRVGLYVLDVSGHGVAAALLSVTVSRFLSPNPDTSSLLWRSADASGSNAAEAFTLESPVAVAERLSRRFPFDHATGQFFTMMYGLLDTRSHRLTYTSAGHPNLLLVRADGSTQLLPAFGFPIGIMSGQYDEYAVDLGPGDRLYIHSDGLSEAMNPARDLFGTARLLDVLKRVRDRPLEEGLDFLSRQIDEWSGGPDRNDDQTILAIERTA
jgi:sigma-B regulation protein RsbU (phosphoserine phosphatase)